MPRKRQTPVETERRSTRRRRLPQMPHGDWRVSLEHPEEAEHYANPPVSVWRRMNVRAEFLQSIDIRAMEAEAEEQGESISGWKQVVHMAFGLALLPVSVLLVFALLVQLYHAAPVMSTFSFWLSEPVWFSVMGGLLMLSLKLSTIADTVLVYIYVLGHELTHAIAAKLCGGRLHGMSVDMSGGYLETDADNWFIALAPYFVPLWMLCWLGLIYIANLIIPFGCYGPLFYAGFGFWWVFHLYWTAWILPREQPDMLGNGIVLSTMVIFIANIGVLLGVLWCFGALEFSGYWADLCLCAGEIGAMFGDVAQWLYQQAQSLR